MLALSVKRNQSSFSDGSKKSNSKKLSLAQSYKLKIDKVFGNKNNKLKVK